VNRDDRTGGAEHHDALVLIDVINDFDFPEAHRILPAAIKAARKIAGLKKRARRAGVPTIYVNDNFGRWRSDFRQQVEHCLGERGRDVVGPLVPDDEDFFVLKPMHSGFFSTSLELLLRELKTERLILCGFAADLCVLYTANDAYMRNFRLVVPRDAVAAEDRRRLRFALDHMENRLGADTRCASTVRYRSKPKKENA
jgi:nicotinamidase-related amidase